MWKTRGCPCGDSDGAGSWPPCSATWLRVKVAQPDWVILRSTGVMTPTALKAAAQVGVPRDKIVGNAPACSEQDMVPAGEAARGFILL